MMNEKQLAFHLSSRVIFIIHHSAFITSSSSSLPAARRRRGGRRREARGEARGDVCGERVVFDREDLPALAVAAERQLDGALARLEGGGRGVAVLPDLGGARDGEREERRRRVLADLRGDRLH